MDNEDISKYAKALTVIGFEDKFISDEKFSHLPPLEKIDIVTGIIDKKLELGRWEDVVEIMYGNKKNIGALYNGKNLEEKIVKSSTQRSTYMKTEAIKTLKEARKNDIIFELAFNIPNLHYEEFIQIAQNADYDFFQDTKKGEQRKQRLNQTAADLAMKEEKYADAFHHFLRIKDDKNINNIFEIVIKNKAGYDDERLLQKIALSDPTQKDSRLKKIILKSTLGEFNPLTAFGLYQEHNIQLSDTEEKALQNKIAKSASKYDIRNNLSQYPKIQLLWAKTNAKDEPRTAYRIFKEQGYNGEEAIMAVQTGLSLNSFENKEKAINTSEIDEQHLKEAYKSAPLKVKVKINHNLLAGAAVTNPNLAQDYLKEFKNLSRQANKANKLELAYDLWIEGRGKFNGKYINKVRTDLIKDCIENHFGIIGFLHSADRKGKVEAYNELIKADNLGNAYKIALELGGKRLEEVHKKMVSNNPRWAADVFEKNEDEKGLVHLTKSIASEYNINPKKLKTLIETYKTD